MNGALEEPIDQMERYIPMPCEGTDRKRLSRLRRFKSKWSFFRAVMRSSQFGVNRPNLPLLTHKECENPSE
jgi:hypothetical protein